MLALDLDTEDQVILTSFLCLFGLTSSAGLVTDDKCIIKQQLSQLKLHIHNEMQAGVKVGRVALRASKDI